MHDEDGYVGEPVAATNDEFSNEMFAPEVWPSELDLMAQMAGMELHERWAGWKREPFTSESTRHVSVWEKPVI